MIVHIARFRIRFSVLAGLLAVLLSSGPLIAQDDPAPSGKPPVATPAEEPPTAKPAEAVPRAKPTEEATPAKPTAEPPVAKPAEATPATKPAEEAPAAKPTEEPPAAKPAEEAPPTKPAVEPPPAKPAVAEPAAKPTEEPPAAKPPEEAPPAKAAEAPTAAKPSVETPSAAPAEATMDESETPVAEEVVEEPPTFDQLGDPQVAQQLSLSAEQNDEIADLLEKRAAALAAAPEATDEERATIIEASETKLAAVLTEVQRGDFLGKPVETRLRFMSRFQQWDEVLTWFAEQAELSLVLDRPPPGTFNYSDTREYTPKEAIDMLNGVLITKGYTLIRRGRMLMVIDLSQDIPRGLVQQVALEDIDKHGKFELVTVQFALGRRSATTVETAIKPVLSPYHKIVSVAATAQMFVTDKAGSMQAVSEIIEALPEPVIKPTPPPAKPEPPVVEVYPLTAADPDTALQVLQAMVPTATLVLDPKLKQINAHAPPSQQSLIKQVLDRMEESTTEEIQQTLELYPVVTFLEADTTGTQLLATLQTAVADAQLSINADKKTLVAWATQAEHEKIKTVIDKLQVVPTPRETTQLEIHRLFRVDPETTLSLFQTILPDARLAVDTKTRNLIAVALPTDQEVIRSTLKTLQPTEPGPDTPELRFYELTLAMPPDFPEVIQKVAPDGTVALDQSGMRLMVIASPAEHAKVEKTLQIMEKTTFVQGRPKLVFYPVTPSQRRRFDAVWQSLSKELPGVSLVTDGTPGELAVWGRPYQHEVITEIMEELKRDVPEVEKFLLQVYPIKSDDPSGVVSMLETLYPETRIVSDVGGERLLVWTDSQEHESIKKSLEELKVTGSEATSTVDIYPLTKADPTSTLTLLQSLVPDATLSLDAKSENIVALAMAEDHQTIKTTLEKLQPDEPNLNKPQLQFYACDDEPPANLVSILQAQAPKAEITVDSESKRLVVLATPTDQETVRSIIEKFQEGSPSDEEAELVVYPIKDADPTSAMTVLQKLVPDAELTLDTNSENLTAIAVPSDHEIIKKTLDTLQTAAAGPESPQLQFYALPRGPPADLVSILQTQTPKANITVEADNKRLVVLATPADHETVKAIIQKYEEATPDDGEANLAVYPIKSADATSALALLQQLVPEAQLSLDAKSENLIAVAVTKDHDTITEALETLESAAAGSDASQMQFYAFDEAPPANLTEILQNLAPKAQITLDAENKRLVVVATTADHEKIKATVDQFQKAVQAEGKPELTVYPIKSADPTSVLTMLQQLYPGEQILLDSTSKRLLVWAKADDQASIKASLEQLTGASPMETPQLEIYRLTKADPAATLTLLQTLVPEAQLTLDSNTNNLIALAVPGDQQVIKATIEQLQPAATDPDTPSLQFHPLSRAPSDSLVSVLQNLAPQAQVTADAENERLMVVATADDHQMIKGVIEEFEASTPPEEKGKLAVYPVTQAQRRRFEAALQTLTEDLPSVQVLPTSEPGELAIWAKPSEHLQVVELLKQLEADVPLDEKPQLMAYTLKSAEPTAVSEVLTKLFPDIEVVTDEKTRKVMVWAPPADQPRISAAVQQIDSGEPGEWEQIFKAHSVPNADLTVALQAVQQLLPEVTFTSDSTAGTILAWATKADHDKIAKMLEELQAGSDKASTAVVYTLEEADLLDVTPIVTFLASAFPDSRFSAGTQPDQVVAWANSKDHEQIKTLIEQMAQKPSADSEPKATVYHLKSITAASAEPILQTAVPQANITVDADNPKRLTVWARASEHETIDGILQEIDVEGDVELSSSAVVYTIEGIDASGISYALTFLSGAFPEARFTQGVGAGQVVAWAPPKEHEQIKTLVDQLSQKSASEVSVYTLKSITAASAIEVLQSALPNAKYTADAENPRRLTAWASQADHEKIKAIVEKIDVEGTADPDAPQLQLYPLDQEPPDSLVTILQSLAPEAEVTADAENKRLAVLASPADQEKIKAAVDQFQQASPAQGKPVLAVYSIRSADPSSVLSMLQTLYPNQQFVLDPTTNRLMAWASPEDQKSITESLEQITGTTGDQQSRFQPYPIRGITTATDAATLVSTLQPLVPDAKLTVGADFKNLIVWATPTDHEVIRQAVEQLGHGASPQNTPQLEVYHLTKANPDTTLALLQNLVPDAQLSLDPQTNNLIALAVPGDQQVIKATLEQLQPGASGPNMPELRFHSLSREPTDDLVSVLKELVPHAQITADAENKRLTVVATPEDHDAIKKVVDEYETSTPPEERGTLMIYPATPAQQRRFEAALGQLSEDLPSVQVLPNSEPGELAIWAVPTEHIRVAELLKRLEGDVASDERPRLAAYTLKSAEPAAVSELLTKLFPDVEVVIDEKTRKVMVWARLEDQARISEAIEQIDSGKPGQWEEEFKAYPLPDGDPAVAVEMLGQLIPDARLSSDSKAGTILAWGTKSDHEKIAQMLEELKAAPGSATSAVIYTLEGVDPLNSSYVIQFLTTAFPNVHFSPGVEPDQVVAWGSTKDHQQVQALIDQLTKTSPETAPKVAVYDLKATTAANAVDVLQTAVPQAKLTTDADNPQRLTAWARTSEHDAIKNILLEIDVEGDPQLASTVAVYKLEGMSSRGAIYAIRFLADLFPKVTFTLGAEEGQIVAWASAKDHPQIKAMIEQLTQASPTDVEVYALKSITAASASQVLSSAVPGAELTVDAQDPQRLTALATAEAHEKIKTILEKIDIEGAADSAATAVIYTLEGMDANTSYYAVRFLTRAFINARFVSGAQPDQLVAWATPKDHLDIKSLIDQMSQKPPPELAPKVAVYALDFLSATDARQVLQTAVPKAEINISTADPNRLTVWARPADHDMIASILQEIDVEGDVESASTAVVYKLEGLTSSGSIYAMRFLTSAFPNARFTVGPQSGQIVAWASAKDHAEIKAMVDQLVDDRPTDVAVYALKSISATNASQVLRSAVPDAELTVDAADPQRLTALGSAEDHETIKKILATIDVEGAADSGAKAVIYRIKGMDTRTGYYKLRFLANAFPKANFVQGTTGDEIVAWATEKDHEQIKSLIDQFGEEAASEIVVYSLKNITATNASTVLRTAVPQAEVTVDTDNPQRFTAWARQEDHDAIKKILATIDIEGDEDSSATVVVYNVEGMSRSGAYYAVSFLSTTFPKARFTAGVDAGQVVAWASAKDHEQIKALVDQMTKEPETDVAVYSLKSITTANAMQVLQTAVPNAKLTADTEDPQRLTAVASTEDHEALKKILETIDVEGAVDSSANAVIYTIKGMDTTSGYYKLRFLSRAFPNASFVQGTEGDQIVAWATAKDHEKIKGLIDQFGEEAASDIVVYSLKNITAANASTVLQTAVPQAKITVDADNPQRMTAWARQEDHDAIKKILATIDIEGDADSSATVVIYNLEGMTSTGAIYAVRFLTTTFPKARFTVGAQPGQVVAWASAKDHEQIKTLVDQMTEEPETDVAVYSLKSITAASAVQVLQSAVLNAKLTTDTDDPQRLTAVASTEDHEAIKKILETIDVEGTVDSTAKAVIYTIKGMDARSGYDKLLFLNRAFPSASFVQGTEGDQIVAWATAKDHEKIKSLIDQFGEEAASEIVVYSLQNITAASASTVLQTAVPQANVTVDADNPQRFTAWARQEDHTEIEKILAVIDVEGGADSAATAVIYTLEGVDTYGATYAVRFLTTAFPKARIVSGAQTGQVVAWATPKDHVEIKNLIDQMSQGPPPERAPKLTVYSLKFISGADASQVLQTAVPQAKLNVSIDDPLRLSAWARPSEHETIATILQELDVEGDAETTSTAVVYTMEGMTYSGTAYAVRFLMTAFPKARFTAGATPGQVVAWASAKDHEQIKTLVDQMTEEPESDVAVYSLKAITAASAVQVLQSAVPNAKLTADTADPQRLTAVASTEDHGAIKKIIETIDVEGAVDSAATAVIYTIKGMDTRTGYYKLRFLASAFPNASFTLGAEGDQIVAWATTKDQEKIKKLIDQFGEEAASEIVVYSLKNISASSASSVLQTAVPQAEITVDADNPQRLTAWARQEDHDTIKKILATIDIEDDADSSATVAVYRLEGMTLSGAIYAVRFLTTTFPKARFTVGAQPGQVVAWASAKDHEEIKTLVDQMTEEPESDVAVYSLKSITAASAVQVLQSAVPNAKLTADTDDPQRLTAVGSAEDHVAIKKIIETIDVEGDPDSVATAVIYTIKGMDALTSASKLTFLSSAFPNASFTQGTEGDQIVAWATVKDHEKIKSIIDQFDEEAASEIVVYSLENISASDASIVLQTAVPQAEITVSADNPHRVTAWARQEDHDAIQKILTTIDVEDDADSSATVVVYTLESRTLGGAIYAVRFLTETFPKARFTIGVAPGRVVAWASAKEHEQIKPLIDKINEEPESVVAVYSLKSITAASALDVLQLAIPDAKLTADIDDPQRLTAVAIAEDHETIKKIIETIDVEGDAESMSRAVVYTLEGMESENVLAALSFLGEAFPDARFAQGAEADQVVAWASAKDHEKIKSLIEQLGQEAASEIVVYTLKNMLASSAAQVLQTAVPQAELTVDTEDPQRLTAWARATDHDTIKTILEKIDVESDPASAATVVIYGLEGMDSSNVVYTVSFLIKTFPKARFTVGTDPGQLVAWASAKDHEKIKELVDELNKGLPPERAPKASLYVLENISGAEAIEVLQAALPDAIFTPATEDPKRLTAWAKPLDHQRIVDILQTIDIEADPELAARAAIYALEGMSQTHAIYSVRFLQQAVPDARLTLGADTTQLVAWASPKDHETIKELVKQLIEESPESARTAKVYNLQHATAENAIQMLSTALPEATLNVGADTSQLIAWARPNDHKKIETIIEQLETKGPPETEPQAIVYTVPSSTATEAMRILRETVPQAKLTIGSEPHQLIAWARPADHEVIGQLVEKMGEKGPDELAPRVAVYKVEAGDATEAITFLQAAVPNAEFSVGSDARRVIAWASPKDHEVIKKAVDELSLGADQISTHVYRFKYADPAAAEAVLGTLVPTANIALDQNEGSLVVSAMPEDHAKIQAAIDEMDSEDAGGQRPVVQVHRITVGDPENVYQSLMQLFSTDTNVQLSLDEQNDAVIAVAPAAKHKRIDDMIKAVAEVAQQDDDTTVELYSMKNVDSSAALDVLDQLLLKQSSKADLSFDYMSNQLVAIGRPEDQELIKKTLEQLRTEETVLEIYELQYVDPLSAEMAIGRQFADEGVNGPRVDVDPNSEQLFIRATEEHQQQIRDLLIKMGETKLKLLKGRSGQLMRTYRTQGDITEALREIQRLWPQLRDNEIRIMSPDTPLPVEDAKEAAKPSEDKTEPAPPTKTEVPEAKTAEKAKPAPPAKPKTPAKAPAAKTKPTPSAKPKTSQPKPDKPNEGPKETTTPNKPAAEKAKQPKTSTPSKKAASKKTALLDDSAWGDEWYFVAQIKPDGAEETDVAKPESPPVAKKKPPTQEQPEPVALDPKQPSETELGEGESKPPPLYVVPGEDSITVVSDDPEALQQFEQLLRTILPMAGTVGRNISVIELKNASAPEVAERLQQLFDSERSTWRRGALPVAIVPDERLNTLVVQGSRIDRQTIEGLVRVLDSDQGEGTKPQIVPLRYADAVEVLQMIQEVFRSQLMSTTSSSRSRTYGTSTSRRRPGVAVDEMTNSLIVMATSPLLEEIIELAQTLDERAGESPARQIKIIPLKKTSASRVEEALQKILNSRSGTTRSSR